MNPELDQDYVNIDGAYREAHARMSNPQQLAKALDNDEYNLLGSFTVGPKIVRVLGEKYTIANALVIAACCLNEQQRIIILNDVHDAILHRMAQTIIDGEVA